MVTIYMRDADHIVRRISEDYAQQACHPDFDVSNYFVDEDGSIYSLFRADRPKQIIPSVIDGISHCTLYTGDNHELKSFKVCDLVAHTFLDPSQREDLQTTVLFKDGDITNNRAANLRWATEKEQTDQVRMATAGLSNRGAAPPPRPNRQEKSPDLDKTQELKRKNESARKTKQLLIDALTPFAKHQLDASIALSMGDVVAYESNPGTRNHSVLTVQNFRDAEALLQELENGL